MRLILLLLLVFVSACRETQADSDVGLYDPVAPEGSAFIRFVNLGDSDVTPKAGKKTYETLSPGEVSAYFVVPEGAQKLSLRGPAEHSFISGEFYTVVNNGNVQVLADQGNSDRSKATIAFYNFSDNAVTLKARGGSVDVLKDVAVNTTQARDMNAVKIDFSLHTDDRERLKLDEEVIERGNHYSVIYDGQKVQFVAATTNTRQ